MKLHVWLILASLLLLAIGISGPALAFHSGGVAACSGCHSMHTPKTGGSFLLIGGDQSSACLTCHMKAGDTGPNDYHVVTAETDMPDGKAPLQRTPGGDFGWLKKTYVFTVNGTAITEQGDNHGHNVVAADYGYVSDPVNTTAPGGTFAATKLFCSSCHDPHGKYRRDSAGKIVTSGLPVVDSGSYNTSKGNSAGNPILSGQAVGTYRLLAGTGYSNAASGVIGYTGVPAAVAPATYNQSEAANQVRVAYGMATTDGHVAWGTWCATCHPNMHSTGNYVHPVDQDMGAIATSYGKYINTGNTTGGALATSFLSLVPFVEKVSDYATLGPHASNSGGYLTGPASVDQVSCLSCHRAHASGFPDILRWQRDSEFITYADATATPLWPGTDNGAPVEIARGRKALETQAGYYDRLPTVFGGYQRSLCNKCHAKD